MHYQAKTLFTSPCLAVEVRGSRCHYIVLLVHLLKPVLRNLPQETQYVGYE